MPRLPTGYSLALILVIAPAFAAEPAAATDTAPTALQSILSADEFARAGLGKLSPVELGALERALADHHLLPSPTPATATRPATATNTPRRSRAKDADFGAEQVIKTPTADTPNELRSRIEGTLEEFSGRSVFVLENGQVWQQRIPEAVHFSRKLVNPEVVISRGLGGYKMVIVPVDRVVFVKRLQ